MVLAGMLVVVPLVLAPQPAGAVGSWASVVPGDYFSCGIASGGAAYCWGVNDYGQLGNGTTTQQTVPTKVSGGLTFSNISVGDQHACGVTTTGAGYCWGRNQSGQLGINSTTTYTTPQLVSGGSTWTSITAGWASTCGVTTTTVGYCWGWNANGQGGTNNAPTDNPVPAAVSGSYAWSSIRAGYKNTCGITTSSIAYCWGYNDTGEVGDNTTTQRNVPTAVSGGLSFSKISTRSPFTICGVTTTNAAYCWGDNSSGQVGDNTTTQRLVPTAVSGGLSFASISVGYYGTCGVTTGNTGYCWGANNNGEIGDNTATERHVPTSVSGGLSFSSISRGTAHTCGITTANAAYCWGNNTNGQVGDGTTTGRYVPTAVSTTERAWSQISVGDSFACALTTTGVAYCWGLSIGADNGSGGPSYGALGNGTNAEPHFPTPVSGGLTFSSISAGKHHVCALTAAGAAYCWGNNNGGQVGDNTTTDRTAPTAVSGGLTFASISAGYYHTCGVTTAGAGYCWGGNPWGDLGDNTTVGKFVPTAISGGYTWSSVSASVNDTCGVTTTNVAYCWGGNFNGEVGDNTTTRRLIPTAVSGGYAFAQITSGWSNTCGVTTTGAGYCWGYGGNGANGDNTTTSTPVPTAVSGGYTWSTMWAGAYEDKCGTTTGNVTYCWGHNASGAVGDNSTTQRTVPTALSGGLTFASVSTGQGSTCGITSTNVAYCWGDNTNGQIGDSTTTQRLVPTAVSTSTGGVATLSPNATGTTGSTGTWNVTGSANGCSSTEAGTTGRWACVKDTVANTDTATTYVNTTGSGNATYFNIADAPADYLSASSIIIEAEADRDTGSGVSSTYQLYKSDGTTSITAATPSNAQADGSWAATTDNVAISGTPTAADITAAQIKVSVSGSSQFNVSSIDVQLAYVVNTAPNIPTSSAQYKSDGTTSLSTGGITNQTSVVVKATVPDIDSSDADQLCVEMQPAGTPFTNTETSCGSAVAQGTTASNTMTVGNNVQYHWQVRSKDAAGSYSSWTQFSSGTGAFTVDTGAPAPASPSSWWDANYAKRVRITLNSHDSALASGYSVPITFDHASMVSGGNSLASGNDVRIVQWNGTTWTELDRMLQPGTPSYTSAWNTSSTKMWFRTTSAISANTTDYSYFMYYANASAGAPPANGNNIFDLYDDFSGGTLDATKWNTYVPSWSSLSVTGGQVKMTGTNTAASPYDLTLLISNASFGPGYYVESSFSIASQDVNSQQNWKGEFGVDSTLVSVKSSGDANKRTKYWTGSAWADIGPSTLQGQSFAAHRTGVAVDGNQKVTEFEDGVAQASHSYANGASNIYVGFAPDYYLGGAAFDVRYDDIFVRKYVANEPTATMPSPSVSDSSLAQYRSDGTTSVSVGDNAAPDSTAVFKGTVTDNVSNVSLCVEAKSITIAFANSEDACSSSVTSGSTASVTLSSLTAGTSYHWQARAKDAQGNYSAWTSFGGNSDGSPPGTPAATDFISPTNTAPSSPASLTQKKTDGTTPIANGAWTNESSVILGGTVSDTNNPDSDQLCVEVKNWGISFDGTGETCAALGAYSGTGLTQSVTISSLSNGSKHWRARTKDAGGLASSWVFSGGSDTTHLGIDTEIPSTTGAVVYDGTSAGVDAGFNNGSLSTLSANWSGWVENYSGLNKYQYSIGTTSGGTDVQGWTPNATATSVTTSGAFTKISAGAYSSCGLTGAGAAYCWGDNTYGQIGDGTTTQRNVPTLVSGGLTFSTISAGRYTACGLTTSGAGYCWGENTNGQLGDGTTTQRNVPTLVSGGLSFSTISPGYFFTCGLTTAGAGYCWGDGTQGEIGDGAGTNRSVPTAVSGGLTFSSISAGYLTACALTSSGVAYCWGYNNFGEVGDGTVISKLSPTAVSGGLTFSSISAGYAVTCGVTTSNAGYCWGFNGSVTIGDGTATDRSVPTAVSGGLSFSSISVGGLDACGVTTTGAAYCWGDNTGGRFGNGTTSGNAVPTLVSGSLSFSAISTLTSTCGLTSTNVTYCWGDNSTGQVGDGTTTQRNVPTSVTMPGLNLHTGQMYYFNVKATDNAGNVSAVVSSNGQMIAPTLTFSVSSTNVTFDRLKPANSFTSTAKTLDINTTTNAYNGYVVRQYTSGLPTWGGNTIDAYSGTYASPTTWAGTGMGYTSSDTSIQASGNLFATATKYAAPPTSGPGDIVADDTISKPSGQTYTLSYKIAVPSTQKSGTYTTSLSIGATASF